MIVTCPSCERTFAAPEDAGEVECVCGRRFDPASKPTVVDPFVGREIGGYRVEELVGRGGMGAVYRAIQLSLERPVAFKVLPGALAHDPQFVSRFHREAEVLASLSHPNVVQVIDKGEVEGRCYLVMEYVEGGSLRRLIEPGPLTVDQAVRVLCGLLDGLAYAHGRDVVHRDIKPENVLLTRDGVVKVVDFGLSRVIGREELRSRLTRTRMVMGTYEYLAPELREGSRDADARADLYSAGVVFYEMLTGEVPMGRFELPGPDPRADRLLAKALAQDPARRHPAAAVMAAEARTLLASPPGPSAELKQRVAEAASATARAASATARLTAAAAKHAATKARRAYGSWTVRTDGGWWSRTLGRLGRRSGRNAPPPTPPPPAPGDAARRVRRPASFESRYDLVLTLMAVLGVLCVVGGAVLLFSGQDVRLGAYDLDTDSAGVVVALFGVLLTLTTGRARRYHRGARVALLALAAMFVPTLAGIPVALLVWAQLLGRTMRAYLDARARGADPARAAALAQDLPLPPPGETEPRRPGRIRSFLGAVLWTLALLGIVALLLWFAFETGSF